MQTHSIWTGIADCMEYPKPGFAKKVRTASASLEALAKTGSTWAALSQAVEALAEWVEDVGEFPAGERYTQLFDLKPVASLNISHHLLGDTYKRGALLAGLVGEMKRKDVPYLHDLPDFLPTLLRLLAKQDDEEESVLLVHSIMLPGLLKVAEKLEDSVGPYGGMLVSIAAALDELYPRGAHEVPLLEEPKPTNSEGLPCSM